MMPVGKQGPGGKVIATLQGRVRALEAVVEAARRLKQADENGEESFGYCLVQLFHQVDVLDAKEAEG
jgi:hypothetical protein